MTPERPRTPTEAENFLAAYARYSDAELERLVAECEGPLGQLRARVLEARRRAARRPR